MALSEFLKNAMELIYLLNKKYMPYYKWSHRGLCELPQVTGAYEKINEIVSIGVGSPKECMEQIEVLCEMILNELCRQKLCTVTDPYLLIHAKDIAALIKEPAIRALPIMFG